MLKKILVIGYVVSFVIFVYGVYKNFVEVVPNNCQMTYMFRTPQFEKLRVTNKQFFSNYGLYYYYEGDTRIDIKSLNGAPVLFVPGNGGSYKQVRSLASVAIRIGMQHKNKVHLDYFTIDYGEELSAFYGGYLQKQKIFLQLCIRAIVKMYGKSDNKTVKIAIVGHSMGGVVAKNVLCEEKFAKHIQYIIFLSAPLDRPVVNFDNTMNNFYEYSNAVLQEKRTISNIPSSSITTEIALRKDVFDDVLLISIGGGVRDLQVPAWLTSSRYSDIHAMTSAIPNVWLSCDHLSIVWCLQLMKVINRFLFSIVHRDRENRLVFRQHFKSNFHSAYKHFIGKALEATESNGIDYHNAHNDTQHTDFWQMDLSHQIDKTFLNLNRPYHQLIPLQVTSDKDRIYIQIQHHMYHDWLYGCIAEETTMSKILICKKIFSLAHETSLIPSGNSKKSFALLDLQNIIKGQTAWTHILVKLPASTKAMSLRYDIHNPTERYIQLKAPHWLDIFKEPKVIKSNDGAAYMQIIIENINNANQAIQFNLKKLGCSTQEGDITISTSASWAKGFDEYHIFDASKEEKRIIVNVPMKNIPALNASSNRVFVDIHLNPSCRLIISPQISFQHTIRRIIQQYYAYLPAHLTAALIVVLAQHYSVENFSDGNVCKKVFKSYFQFESMFIAIACHLLQPFLTNSAMSNSIQSLLITIMLQGTAIIMSSLIAVSFCTILTVNANAFIFILPRLSSIGKFFSFAHLRTIFTLRLTIGIVIASITIVTCSSIGLALTFFIYFIWLSNVHKEHLLKRVSSQPEISKESDVPLTLADAVLSEEIHLNIYNQQNFLLHFKLVQLLFVLTSQHAVEIVAWLIKYPGSRQIFHFDPEKISIILMLISWTFFWEMEDLVDLYNNKIISILLYGSAAVCFFFCEENVFILNYVIAFVYIVFLLLGSLYKLQQFSKKSSLN